LLSNGLFCHLDESCQFVRIDFKNRSLVHQSPKRTPRKNLGFVR
jgi:hypothetical protein